MSEPFDQPDFECRSCHKKYFESDAKKFEWFCSAMCEAEYTAQKEEIKWDARKDV